MGATVASKPNLWLKTQFEPWFEGSSWLVVTIDIIYLDVIKSYDYGNVEGREKSVYKRKGKPHNL